MSRTFSILLKYKKGFAEIIPPLSLALVTAMIVGLRDLTYGFQL
jgi:hypothetical protein